MWISRNEYEALIDRINKLEARENKETVKFGHWSSYYFSRAPTKDEFIANTSDNIYGDTVSVRELVCLIANHLGFTYTPGSGGRLTAPETKKGK